MVTHSGGIFGGFGKRRSDARRDTALPDSVSAASASIGGGFAVADAVPPRSRLLALPAEDHAREFLAWMTGPGGRTGLIAATELAEEYQRMVAALEIEPTSWRAVGRELRKLLGQGRIYVDRGRKRVRAYRIPPADADGRLRAEMRWAALSETRAA